MVGSIVRCRIVSPKPGTSSVSAPGSSELKHYTATISTQHVTALLHRYTLHTCAATAQQLNPWRIYSAVEPLQYYRRHQQSRVAYLLMWTWGWGRIRGASPKNARLVNESWINSNLGKKMKHISNMKYLLQKVGETGETPVVWLWRVTVVGCKCVNHLCKHWTLNAAVKYG